MNLTTEEIENMFYETQTVTEKQLGMWQQVMAI
jgi:hypothetical protein